MPLAKPKACVRQALNPGVLETHPWSQRDWEATADRRNAQWSTGLSPSELQICYSTDAPTRASTAWSSGSPSHLCSVTSAPFSPSLALFRRFGPIRHHHQPEKRWVEDVLATTWAAKWEAQLKTPHSTREIMLFVYCRWSLQEGSFQPEEPIHMKDMFFTVTNYLSHY